MKHFLAEHFHLINIPPLLAITLFFIIGIIWHTMLIPFTVIFILVLCSYFLIARTTHVQVSQQLILYLLFTCIGAHLHQKELRDYDYFYQHVENKKVNITGTVIDKNIIATSYKKSTAVIVAVDTVATDNFTHKSNKVAVFYSENNINVTVGDTVTFVNVCCKKPISRSFQQYQIKEQIVATIFNNKLNYVVHNHPTWSLRRIIFDQKKRLLDSLAHKLSETGFRFFSSLFLGNRMCIKAALEQTNEQFKVWGISHFLARSGLHLALFIFIWQAIFCIIPLPLYCKQLAITCLSSIYFILTWTSAPFTRSFALFMLNKLCLFTKTPFHLLHYLILVCFGFLLYCPLYLFFLDFQLSFALTFALAWFNQLAAQHVAK